MSEKRYWKIESEEDYNRVCEITGKRLRREYSDTLRYYGINEHFSISWGYNAEPFVEEGYTLQTLDTPTKPKPKAWKRTVEMARESDGVVFTKDTIDGRTIEQIDKEREELRGKLAEFNKLVATYKRLDKAGKLD